MKIIRRSGLVIPRQENENEIWYQQIKKDLTRRAKDYQTGTFVIQKFYLESDKNLLIPRYFPIKQYNRWVEIEDHSHEGEEISISHNITPRDALQSRAITHMLENKSGILELQPGVGKTVISIMAIATRKRKTFILVHRESLSTQWKNRVLDFTNLQSGEVAILKSKSFLDDLEHPIIIATNQTILSLLKSKRIDFLIGLNKANVGIFIGDEVHTTVGAPTFSECSIHMPCKYTYGLSATPYRWDGNSDIIEYHLGDVYADNDDSSTMEASVTIVVFDFGIDQPYRFKYLYWAGKFQRSRYLNIIKNSKMFLKVINELIKLFKSKERNIVVMTERIKMIDILEKSIGDIENVSRFVAGSSLNVLKKQITLTTPGKMRDGVDAPWKDLLIMTSPISNIAQVAGRVTRDSDNKQTPIIVDMVDLTCAPIKNTIHSRIKYYEEKCWKVQYVHIDNDLNKKVLTKKEFNELL